MTHVQTVQKKPDAGKETVLPLPMVSETATHKVFILHSSYLQKLVRSGYGVEETLERLVHDEKGAKRGDLVVSESVLFELRGSLMPGEYSKLLMVLREKAQIEREDIAEIRSLYEGMGAAVELLVAAHVPEPEAMKNEQTERVKKYIKAYSKPPKGVSANITVSHTEFENLLKAMGFVLHRNSDGGGHGWYQRTLVDGTLQTVNVDPDGQYPRERLIKYLTRDSKIKATGKETSLDEGKALMNELVHAYYQGITGYTIPDVVVRAS